MSPAFRTVLLDCDSTLSALEGIDELAAEHRQEIAALTAAAMRGELPLEEVYGRRLAVVRPGRERVEALGRAYVAAMVPGAREAVAALRDAGVHVRVLSGGLRPAVLRIAREVGIPDTAVGAVDVFFTSDGAYAGFDAASPLTRSGGKAEAVRRWLAELPRPILMVGDGVTDAEARPPADAFAAFTGVIERPAVVAVADAVARTMDEVVALALGRT